MSKLDVFTSADSGLAGSPNLDRYKVLVVDDDEDALEELAESLMDAGIDCLACDEPGQALEIAISDESVIAIVTDYMMPRMNGLEMLRRLRETRRGQKIACLFVSGNAGKPQVVEALRLGAAEFFDKPVDPNALVEAVSRAVAKVQAREKSERALRDLSEQTNALGSQLFSAKSDLERREIDLKVSRQARSEFLSMMGHELRTPLNAVLGSATLLIDCGDRFDPSTRTELLRKIHSGGERLLHLINSILDLTDFGGDDALMVSETTVEAILEPVTIACRGVAEKAGHEVEIEDRTGDAVFSADRVRLSQALRFLLDNALSFMPKPGKARVVVETMGDDILFHISDQGAGMTSEQITVALQPLTQVNGSLTRSVDGIGIGLPLAQRFVEAHGGDLSIKSEPGVGTTVTVRVPQHFTPTDQK